MLRPTATLVQVLCVTCATFFRPCSGMGISHFLWRLFGLMRKTGNCDPENCIVIETGDVLGGQMMASDDERIDRVSCAFDLRGAINTTYLVTTGELMFSLLG